MEQCNVCKRSDVELHVCSRCRRVSYCGRDHQREDWKVHKKFCSILAMEKEASAHEGVDDKTEAMKRELIAQQHKVMADVQKMMADLKSMRSTNQNETDKMKESLQALMMEKQKLEESKNKMESEAMKLKQNLEAAREDLTQHETILKEKSKEVDGSLNVLKDSNCGEVIKDLVESGPVTNDLVKHVASALEEKGHCVVDQFLGMDHARSLRETIKGFDDDGMMKPGQLGGGRSAEGIKYEMKDIRGDRIAWIGDGEHGNREAPVIGHLEQLDLLVRSLGKHVDELKNTVSERNKAMCTVYPGNGARYIKHADNPHGDGRILTCIYYLNENWVPEHGGTVKLYYPTGDVEVEPIADRLVIFWSDKRTPHEVLPSYVMRYACTVWYFDRDQKMRAANALDNEEERKSEIERIQKEIAGFEKRCKKPAVVHFNKAKPLEGDFLLTNVSNAVHFVPA